MFATLCLSECGSVKGVRDGEDVVERVAAAGNMTV
jgi:hypothetical protein